MSKRDWIWPTAAGAVVTAISSQPLLRPCSDGSLCGPLVYLALPGIFFSSAIAGNIHAFWTPLVVVFNWIIYAVIAYLILKVVRVIRAKQLN